MKLSDLFFPPHCLFCRAAIRPETITCERCNYLLELPAHKKYLPYGAVCVSSFKYEGVYRDVVVQYKFGNARQQYAPLAHLMKRLLDSQLSDVPFDCVTVVPQHPDKIKSKQFDQLSPIVKEFSRISGIPFIPMLLQTRFSKQQHTLNYIERIANIKDCFDIIDPDLAKEKRILVMDDVVTTGSTLTECNRVIMENGAKSVHNITICW